MAAARKIKKYSLSKPCVCLFVDHNRRAEHLARAFIAGLCRHAVYFKVKPACEYKGDLLGDIAVFYGLRGPLFQVYQDYQKNHRTTVFIDLGYWGRHDGGRLAGYHRVVVNGFQPTAYFQNKSHDGSRFDQLHISLENAKRQQGDAILLAGMSEKSAGIYGLRAEEFERRTISILSYLSSREIIYRPKPSWTAARPLPKTHYSPPQETLAAALQKSWCVVTHHSNVAIDGLLAGRPCIVLGDGVGKAIGSQDLASIEKPYYPDEMTLRQFCYDLAWTQWKPDEIKHGDCWEYLRQDNLIE